MLGFYRWLALLKDGRQIEQFTEGRAELSIDELRGHPVVAICLLPMQEGFAPIQFDVEGSDWLKCWTRTFQVAELPGGVVTQSEAPCIEKLGLRPKGSPVWVYLYIYHTGVVRMTLEEEP